MSSKVELVKEDTETQDTRKSEIDMVEKPTKKAKLEDENENVDENPSTSTVEALNFNPKEEETLTATVTFESMDALSFNSRGNAKVEDDGLINFFC